MRKIAFRDDPEGHQELWPSIYTKLSYKLEVAIKIPFELKSIVKLIWGR